MRTLSLLAAATALGAVAAPAAAQYYPAPQPQPYPGQPGYGYPQQGYGYPQQQQQGGIAGIIGQLLGNRYAGNDRQAITQCANAASIQAARQYRPAYNQNPYGNAYGYNQRYAGQARVTAITNVERRNRGLRVTGLMDSGMNGYSQQYGGQYGGYGQQAYAQGDLSFRCNVDYQGRVTNLRLNRVNNRRGY